MQRRRHHNTKGQRQIRRGRTREQVKAMAERLGVPYGSGKAQEMTIESRMQGSVRDYHVAPGGDGPLADEWRNKPHRLLYDLLGEIQALTADLLASRQARAAAEQERAEMIAARDKVRASFGHGSRNAEGKCQCIYCRGDVEGMFEHAADYELRNFHLLQKLEAAEQALNAPDSGDRLLLNRYGRACYDAGRKAVEVERDTLRQQLGEMRVEYDAKAHGYRTAVDGKFAAFAYPYESFVRDIDALLAALRVSVSPPEEEE